MNVSANQRSRKSLACTTAATAYQKAFGKELRRKVVDEQEPFAIVQADTPHEIFHAMDIPIITNQWWSAYISAKQLSARYFDTLVDAGYPANSCKYCSLGLACTLANDPETAPWGGLPKPTVLVARLTCDCIQHVFGQWAEALGSEFFPMEAPAWVDKDLRWYAHAQSDWERVYQPDRIAQMVREMEDLIALLEKRTGRRFDEEKFHHLMEQINVQEGYIWEAAQAIGAARPCPVSIAEQMPNTMIPQWHRGSEWAVGHAKRFRDEVMERINQGLGASSRENIRLMWIGAGVWHDPGFYQALEESLGAVFVWSMYMPFAGPSYIRDLHGRPMEALASRVASMNETLHLPPWMNGWMTAEAQRCGIDAAVMLLPPDNRLSQSGTKMTASALEDAGVPVLMIDADMVDAKIWDHDRMVGMVADFLAEKGLA
ncbi:benzoyl-CoA reductase/2-hydroxyglutaryl-CoA dehydratase subunit BcrC/BadD/HgdB [Altererythrobacter atlanticus]|uniref:R-phenyllactate dehydratase subunit alpha n=1 Tax=Croceibacterium atlanticum TaxID=1267766 RepID=A0A0F7KRY7_9SPHN|nr:2-hydroxyacyl-CoA dehydratase family protein [Croceibacterium atlanticum]AKH41510.1 R-phenyllactate dehydratase subunit alpha precursor [Croceibacterium atlanticum]MBB5732972.1 benzoyl-CoA reductase/2-hydroxyglutaryl-CoA dehydratase subunit BcrC/BadD/HgdB [Croceibacterium atlanticum]